MFDPITLGVGGALLAVGWLAGRLTGVRTVRSDMPRATCGCDHDLSLHDPETKKCHAEIARQVHDDYGYWVSYEWVPCPCRQYIGPKPIEEVFAPPYLPPSE